MILQIIEQKLLERPDTKIVLKDLGGIWEESTNTLKINTFESKIPDSTWNDSDDITVKDIYGVSIFKLKKEEGEDGSWLNKNKVTTIIDIEFPSTVKATLVPEYVSTDIEYLESHGKSVIGNLRDLDIYISGEGVSSVYKSDWYRYIKISRDTPTEYSYPYVNSRGEIITSDNISTEYTDLITFFSDGKTVLLNGTNCPIVPIYGVATKITYIISDGEKKELKKEIISLRDVPGIKFCFKGIDTDYNYDDTHSSLFGKFDDATFTLYLNENYWDGGSNLFPYFSLENGTVSNVLRISSSSSQAASDTWDPVYISGINNRLLLFSPGITNNVVLKNDARSGEPDTPPKNIKIVVSDQELNKYFIISTIEEVKGSEYQVKFNITLSEDAEISTTRRLDLSIQDSDTDENIWSGSAVVVSGSTSEYHIYGKSEEVKKIRLPHDQTPEILSTLGSSSVYAKFIRTFDDYVYDNTDYVYDNTGGEEDIFGRVEDYITVEGFEDGWKSKIITKDDRICYNEINLGENANGGRFVLMITKDSDEYSVIPNSNYGTITSIDGPDYIAYTDEKLTISLDGNDPGFSDEIEIIVHYEGGASETIKVILNTRNAWQDLYISQRVPNVFSKEKTIGYFIFSNREISSESLGSSAVSVYPVTVLPGLQATFKRTGSYRMEMQQVMQYIGRLTRYSSPTFIGTGEVTDMAISVEGQNSLGLSYTVLEQKYSDDDISVAIPKQELGENDYLIRITSLDIRTLPESGTKEVNVPVKVDDATLDLKIVLASQPNFIGFFKDYSSIQLDEERFRKEIINIFEEEIEGWGHDNLGIATGDLESNNSISKTLSLVSVRNISNIIKTPITNLENGSEVSPYWDVAVQEEESVYLTGHERSLFLPQGYNTYSLSTEITRLDDTFPQYPACKLSSGNSNELFVFYMPKNPYKIAKIPRTVWITRDEAGGWYSTSTPIDIPNNYFTFSVERGYSTYGDYTGEDPEFHPGQSQENIDSNGVPYVRYISHAGLYSYGRWTSTGERAMATWDYHENRSYLDGVFFYNNESYSQGEGITVTLDSNHIVVSAVSQKYYNLRGSDSPYDDYVAEVYILESAASVLPHADHFPAVDILSGLGISSVHPVYEYNQQGTQLGETYRFTNGKGTLYPTNTTIYDNVTNGELSSSDARAIVISRVVIRSREDDLHETVSFNAEGETHIIKAPLGSFEDDCNGFFTETRDSRREVYYISSSNRYTNILDGIEILTNTDLSAVIDNWISKKEGIWKSSGGKVFTLIGKGITNFMMLGDKFYGIDYIIKTGNNIASESINFSSSGETKSTAFSLEIADDIVDYEENEDPGNTLDVFLSNSTHVPEANFDIVNSDGTVLYQWKWSNDPVQSEVIEDSALTFSYIPGSEFEFFMPENRGEDIDYKVIIYYNSSDAYGGYKIAEINLHQDKKTAIDPTFTPTGIFSPAGYGQIEFILSEGTSTSEDSFSFPELSYTEYQYDSSNRKSTIKGKLEVENYSGSVQDRVISVKYEQTGEIFNIIANQDFCRPRYSDSPTGIFDNWDEITLPNPDSKLYYKLWRSFDGGRRGDRVSIDSIDIDEVTYTLTDKDGEHEYNIEDIFNKLSTEIVLSSSNQEEVVPYIKTISEIKESYRTTKLKLTADVKLVMEYTENTDLADAGSIQAECVNTIRIIYTIN